MWRTTILALALLVPAHLDAQDERPRQLMPTGPYVYGQVVFPDGTPAPGARVSYTGVRCNDPYIGLFRGEATTNADGEFRLHFQRKLDLKTQSVFLPSFPGCERVIVGASLEEDLWLSTLGGSFHEEQTAVLQEFELLDGLPHDTDSLVVPLSVRGALLNIHVWDRYIQQNVEARISLSRHDCMPEPCGLIQVRYEANGNALSRLVPAGHYRIELEEFQCGNRRIFVDHPSVALETEVSAGEHRLVRLEFDSTRVQPAEAYDNPYARPCLPGDFLAPEPESPR